MSANDNLLRRVRERIAREFPELSGSPASVTPQAGGTRYLVVTRGYVSLPGGKRLERVVRAVVDANGRIVKWSTSR